MGAFQSSDANRFTLLFSLSTNKQSTSVAGRQGFDEVSPVWSIAITSNGKQLASASSDNRIHLWCLVTFRILVSLTGHGDAIWMVRYSPNDEYLLSTSADGTMRVWEVATGYTLNVFRGHSSWVWGVAWAHDSETFASGGTDSRICVWNIHHPKMPLCQWQGHVKSISALCFIPSDETRLVSVSSDETIAVWDTETGELICRLEGHIGNITSVQVCPMNDQLIATGGEDCTVRLWSLRDITPSQAAQSCLLPRGYNLAHHVLKGHIETVQAVSFSSDGRLLASGSQDRCVRVWHVSAKQPALSFKFEAHEAWVKDVTWTADMTVLASASTDGLISLWQVPQKHWKPGASPPNLMADEAPVSAQIEAAAKEEVGKLAEVKKKMKKVFGKLQDALVKLIQSTVAKKDEDEQQPKEKGPAQKYIPALENGSAANSARSAKVAPE